MKSRKKFTSIFYSHYFYAQENKNYEYIIVINIHAIIELQKYNGIIFLLKFIINIRKNLS